MDASKSGTEVYCLITDANGGIIQSESTTLSLLGITKQPKPAFAADDEAFTLSVEAEGEDLTYHWYYRYPDDSYLYPAKCNEAIYTGTISAYRSGMLMRCLVYNGYGEHIYSEEVVVSWLGIDTQPTGDCAASGKTVSTTVVAQGNDLTYQWYVKDPGGKFKKSSVTKDTYSFKMTKEKSGRQVYCVVTNKEGHSIKTDTVKPSLLAVKTQPKNAYADSGKTASTTVKATGSGLKYTWYVKDPGKDTFVKSSTTKATYSFKMTKAKSGRQVYCVITDKYGNTVQTETVTMKLKEKVKLTGQLTGAAAASKEKVSVTVAATGDGLTYTWYVKDPGKTKFTKSSVKTDTYSYTMTSAKAGRQVYCVVKDRYGNKAKTNTVTLSMITITQQPSSMSLEAEGKASASIKASGKGLTYQWYVKNYKADTFSKSSATGKTYSCKITESKPSRQIYCVITDKYGNSVQSNTVTLKIKDDVWREECWWCDGDGKCDDCGGRGEVYKWMAGTNKYVYVRCTDCNNGRCRRCGGTGWE